MTISIAWIRKQKENEELLFISDSRLRSFGAWDIGPKIFLLNRTDCAICFAGDTIFAYPFMNQILTAVDSFNISKNRFQDITHFQGHLLNLINYMLEFKTDKETPNVMFLFGGYSWKMQKFILWRVYYDKENKEFVSSKVKKWNGLNTERIFYSIGDYTHEFKSKLVELLKSKNKLINGNFDMEPLEVLVKMIQEKDDTAAIGGSPQLVKVYRNLNRLPFGVKWRINEKNHVTLLGRPLMEYEKINYPVIDPISMKINNGPSFSKAKDL